MKNDEIRMTNDESNSNVQMTNVRNDVRSGSFEHSNIRHSDLIRHSSFEFRHSLICVCLWLILAFLSGCDSRTEVPTSDPPLVKHALIVTIDGCRPDILLRANTPNIRELMRQGSFTFWAQTTALANTLPSHTSLLTGTPPEVHGITFNDDGDGGPTIYPNVPTIFEVAKAKGLTTAVFAGKPKFTTFTRPGAVDWSFITPSKPRQFIDDDVIAARAAQAIRWHKPNITFVHLAATDIVGHGGYYWVPRDKQAWGSNEHVWCVERADAAIGMLIDALKFAGIYDDCVIIITADHGGSGRNHGANDPRSRFIPWICVGPGVREDCDLTQIRKLTVHIEDTFATVSYFLGLPIDPKIMGRPVMQVFDDPEEPLWPLPPLPYLSPDSPLLR